MNETYTVDAITKVNRDLTEILNLSQALTAQAISRARDRMMPGGYAMVALAGVASPAAHAQWLDEAEEQAIADALQAGLNPIKAVQPIETDDDEWDPPLQTLRFWTEQWRAAHQSPNPEHATLESEANYIRWTLPWALVNEPNWAVFAQDINGARTRLESILHAGSRPDRTRVVCDREHCTKHPRLIRVRATREAAEWSCTACSTTVPLHYDGTHCPNPWCYSVAPPRAIWKSDESKDRWKCTSCKHRYDDDDYRRAHAKQLRSAGAERFVVLSDAIATLKSQGRPEPTVREWLKVPEHVEDQCNVCATKYDPSEHGSCPRKIRDPMTRQYLYDETGEPINCGGDLTRIWSPSLEDITEGYCELGTRRRMIWWPDLWRLHLTTRTRNRRKISA